MVDKKTRDRIIDQISDYLKLCLENSLYQYSKDEEFCFSFLDEQVIKLSVIEELKNFHGNKTLD